MSFPLIKLGDLFEIQIGKTPSRANQNYWTNGLYNWLSIADMNQGKYLDRTKEKINDLAVKESNIKLIPENTVVLSYKLSIGKVGITKKSMFTNEAIASLIPLNNNIDINFLYWALQHIDLMANTDRAAMGQTLNKAKLKEIKIPLPSLSEQKRIAEILDKADELRQKRQQSIEKLDELLQATFIDMFGDPITNPKGWEICEVGKVTDCIVPARDKPKSFTGDIPWITTDDLNHLGFTETSKKNIGLTNEEITLAKARLIPKNSVVISCVGNLGLASIASDNFVMNQQLHSFQCGDKILPEFLIFCLPFQKGYMLSRATSTTVPYMNKSVCNSIPVTVPPLDLQKKWKLIFENSNKQKQVLKKQLAQQENLFQSLQQRAFNGEL